ncbi:MULTISPECIES: AI-2E family transporter [unclassified Roseitalea]|uniref:AI-2E family transporter n=1 Tax=unclassified Roseitalea TaxID=2639107 RepID=UPI00273E03E4|nr:MULTISPECIES: AI-2E family transporter [unclassified Roseitalea]
MVEQITVKTLRRQAIFWLGALALFIVFLYIFRSILLPFLAGFALAYFLDPIADFLERRGSSRLVATILILVAFILVFALALVSIVPTLVGQFAEFIDRFPEYLARLRELAATMSVNLDWLDRYIDLESGELPGGLEDLIAQGTGFVTGLAQGIWSSGMALINIAGLFVITPVVAFYMLLDWDRMIARIDACVPRDHVETVREIGADMNRAVAGFVRGQGTVCLILGLFYALALTVAGLNFGLLIGLFAGLISFIPYVGSLVGLILSVGVALVQFWPDWIMIAIIAAIFFVGQTIEGNFLQPKLVGDSVGLHPVWLMFALFAFGSLFGFTGMLIAVPAAAAVGVLVRFAVARYLDSDLYVGSSADDAEK